MASFLVFNLFAAAIVCGFAWLATRDTKPLEKPDAQPPV